MKKLEVDKILNFLTEYCVSDGGKQMVIDLKPSYDIEEVQDLLEEVSVAKSMINTQGSPELLGIKNVENSLKRTELSGVLSCLELLEVATLLKTARLLSSYHEEIEDRSVVLDKYFNLLSGDARLENAIFNAVLSDDELSDTASSELFEIRRKIRSLNAKTREHLNKMIAKENKFLQENLISIRNDRFVIPVKSEHKGDVSGLIHDVSSSGSTLFIEPQEVVLANNELRILIEEEKREVERILKMFSQDIKKIAENIRLDFKVLSMLDFIFAKAKLSIKMNANRPKITDNGHICLKNAIHPLLDPKTAVPVSIEVGGEFDTLIITGPNTGGKTVCLKTLGLLTVMTSLGLHIPADSDSFVYIGGKVYADIGDEQSIGESLSTFSSHMTNIISILEIAEENDLLLFDELGSGTDPLEGSALAVSIIEHARKLSCKILATTHYSDIKLYALETDGVKNASFEFDMETLSPTYNLIIGSPGKSNAFEISTRLGLNCDIIANARTLLSSEHNRFEKIIENLESDTKRAEEFKKQAEEMRVIAKNALIRAESKEKSIDDKYDSMVEKARLQSVRMLDQAKLASKQTFAQLDELKKMSKDDVKSANIAKARSEIYGNLSELEIKELQRKQRKAIYKVTRDQIKVGMEVRLLKTNNIVTVISLPDKQDKIVCKAGILKMTVSLEEIEIFSKNPQKPKNKSPKTSPTRELRNNKVQLEVDVRGMDSLEALSELELFISSSIMSNIDEGMIIHGHGTGVLKSSIRSHLRSHKHIKSFRPGKYGEGEDGVTVITFK